MPEQRSDNFAACGSRWAGHRNRRFTLARCRARGFFRTLPGQRALCYRVPSRSMVKMKMRMLCLFMAVIANSGAAFAACGDSSSYLNQQQVSTILSGNYACGRSTGSNPPGWNEQHVSGGSLVEQHEGGTTVETVGTWATSNSSGRGRVTYSYAGGVAPVYEVAVVTGSCSNGCTTLPQTYQFCGVGGGAPAVLSIYVSSTFQAPSGPPFVMNGSCPSNP